MDEIRINAAFAELQWQLQMLSQRNIGVAGDLAIVKAERDAALKEIARLNTPIATPQTKRIIRKTARRP